MSDEHDRDLPDPEDAGWDSGGVDVILLFGLLVIIFLLYQQEYEYAIYLFITVMAGGLLSKTISGWREVGIYG